jgi:hypothetical protein
MVQRTKEHKMTNSQQKILASLEANIKAAQAVGLSTQLMVEDHDYFISAQVRVDFDRSKVATMRNGHYQEFSAHLMIGKRGGIDGTCRTGSVFSRTEYKKGVYIGNSRPDIFSMIVDGGCKYGINEMIETAQRMTEFEKGAA